MRIAKLRHKFVSTVPETLEDGVLYVSPEYRTMTHKCCCGCGHEVVTPLGPTDWKLTFDGVSISLYPSIGNWSLTCRSHYWIDQGAVKWAGQWSEAEIAAGRAYDRSLKERYYAPAPDKSAGPTPPECAPSTAQGGFLAWLKRWFSS